MFVPMFVPMYHEYELMLIVDITAFSDSFNFDVIKASSVFC